MGKKREDWLTKSIEGKSSIRDGILNAQTEKEMSHLKNKRVLLVDDSEEFTLMVTALLKKCGILAVKSLHDETRTMEEIIKFNPDIVMIDIMMPSVGGFTVGKVVQELTRSLVPIIYVTANKSYRQDLALQESERTEWLFKPVSLLTLQEKMTKLLGRK
ncbi:MAG: response regulator [Bdellovibrionales bacterium]|jgi:DNA-binding response OmpR family regulator|nr:response regulator [Bdellovibrionales bacterium]MBT3526551.1 response regulator [Bdellovibrionales bacterium]MBT7669245.1 response regulator [Bdellovibrionales bacterium]MBT7767938.1 response regulator [Bdellovibrionales bacterium]